MDIAAVDTAVLPITPSVEPALVAACNKAGVLTPMAFNTPSRPVAAGIAARVEVMPAPKTIAIFLPLESDGSFSWFFKAFHCLQVL